MRRERKRDWQRRRGDKNSPFTPTSRKSTKVQHQSNHYCCQEFLEESGKWSADHKCHPLWLGKLCSFELSITKTTSWAQRSMENLRCQMCVCGAAHEKWRYWGLLNAYREPLLSPSSFLAQISHALSLSLTHSLHITVLFPSWPDARVRMPEIPFWHRHHRLSDQLLTPISDKGTYLMTCTLQIFWQECSDNPGADFSMPCSKRKREALAEPQKSREKIYPWTKALHWISFMLASFLQDFIMEWGKKRFQDDYS